MDFLSFILFIYFFYISSVLLSHKNGISLQHVCATLTALMTINSTNNLQMLIDMSSYLLYRYRGYITMDDETWLAMSKYIEPKILHKCSSILTHMHSDARNPDQRTKYAISMIS